MKQNRTKRALRSKPHITRLMNRFITEHRIDDAHLDSVRFDHAFGLWLGWVTGVEVGNALLISYRLDGRWVVVPFGVWPRLGCGACAS